MHCQRCPETPEFRSRIRIFAREFAISRGVPFDAADNRLRRKFRRPNALDSENEVPKAAPPGLDRRFSAGLSRRAPVRIYSARTGPPHDGNISAFLEG